MGALSDYAENELLDHFIGGSSFSPPGNTCIALFTADPGDTGTANEVSGTSYARVTVANNTGSWGTASGGVKSNQGAITFPAAGGDWGTVTHIGIFDAASSGNLLLHGALTTPKTISAGDVFKFNAGGLQITLS